MEYDLLLTFIIGEGGPNLFKLSIIELLQTLAGIVVLIGLLVAWRWEGIGGMMITGGIISFYALEYIASGKFPGGPVFPIFYLPGILFLICRVMSKYRTKSPISEITEQ